MFNGDSEFDTRSRDDEQGRGPVLPIEATDAVVIDATFPRIPSTPVDEGAVRIALGGVNPELLRGQMGTMLRTTFRALGFSGITMRSQQGKLVLSADEPLNGATSEIVQDAIASLRSNSPELSVQVGYQGETSTDEAAAA
ncbi:MAG: hypothetical protein AAB588_01785 [Patescibacteria group bacterium]|mgnify:CR=1 FL=1